MNHFGSYLYCTPVHPVHHISHFILGNVGPVFYVSSMYPFFQNIIRNQVHGTYGRTVETLRIENCVRVNNDSK